MSKERSGLKVLGWTIKCLCGSFCSRPLGSRFTSGFFREEIIPLTTHCRLRFWGQNGVCGKGLYDRDVHAAFHKLGYKEMALYVQGDRPGEASFPP